MCSLIQKAIQSLRIKERKTRGNKQTAKKDANFVGALTCYYGNVPDRFGEMMPEEKRISLFLLVVKTLVVFMFQTLLCLMPLSDVQGTTDAILFVFGDNFGVTDGRVNQGAVMKCLQDFVENPK